MQEEWYCISANTMPYIYYIMIHMRYDITLHLIYHRIIEVEAERTLRKSSGPTPMLKQDHLEQVTQRLSELASEMETSQTTVVLVDSVLEALSSK